MKKIRVGMVVAMAYMQVCSAADMSHAYQRLERHIQQLRTWAQQYRAVVMPPEVAQPAQYSFAKHFLCDYEYAPDVKQVSFVEASSYIRFEHPDILACVAVIQQEERLDVFFTMWGRFAQKTNKGTMCSSDDELFIKDCGTLLFLFYNNILQEMGTVQITRVTIQDVMELYELIMKLPIDELLNILDTMIDHLIAFLQRYPLQDGQSMFNWLRVHWWLPPVILSAIIAHVVLN